MVIEHKKIRVLVVDDSAVMRKIIPAVLESQDGLEVIGTAIDGDFALKKIEQFRPDVVTMDIEMPRMDGISALEQIVSRYSIPVIMLSTFTTRGAALTMKALELGAVDFICKPRTATEIGEMAGELVSKVRMAANARMVDIGPRPRFSATGRERKAVKIGGRASAKIVAIGASSGGPHALRFLLPRIPADFGAGIVIVQHMPESFTAMLARWLNEICEIEVREAVSGDIAFPGTALIAPGSSHLKVKMRAIGAEAVVERGHPVNGHMPSVDILFQSVAAEFGENALGVIMTGMGCDGSAGIGEMKKRGAHTIAQDRESCAIYGMPRVAVEKGHIDRVVPLAEMAGYMVSAMGQLEGVEAIRHADTC